MENNVMKIKGYENYEVTTTGEVINVKTGRALKLNNCGKGYLQVNLYKNGKRKVFLVHRLVAETFIPNPDNLPEVNHKDENKTNNCIENLEWCTTKYNTNYGTGLKKRSKKVYQFSLNNGFIREWKSLNEIEKHLGYFHNNIGKCCRDKQETAYGFKWRYAEK